jgi:hypothetical protein
MEIKILYKVKQTAKRLLPFGLLTVLPILSACDHIDENDRLIYVEPVVQNDSTLTDSTKTITSTLRTVLLEDFTGQMCVNCPKGTEVIKQLQDDYAERLVAVGIHGGPLGFKGNATTIGLATDLGDKYYDSWQLEYQPVGLIDRHGAVNYTDWVTEVRKEMAKTSSISMELEATLNDNQITIITKATSLEGTYDGQLQLWVLEDSITATQKRHDPIDNDNVTISDKNYLHNHVLRCAVNGSWGESIHLNTNDPIVKTYPLTVDAAWEASHLSIVAFLYNNSGVEQAIKTKVKE